MAVHLSIDADDLRALVKSVVRETLEELRADDAKANGRVGLTEPEAAELLGVRKHVLRDLRYRGEIQASRVGRRLIYRRHDLEALMAKLRE